MIIDCLKKLTLTQICTVLFIAGLFGLVFIVFAIKPEPMMIKDIDETNMGKTITINATVAKKEIRKGNLFLELFQDESYIKAVMFESSIKENFDNISTGNNISIIGRIDKYMGEIEIIIKEIR
ncbi:MAG: exodeoxyribonuclease VII large subunit [Candidatus Aenigmarchaeota archaeon]|nr:exodeoxyribonuclease VII large subunit [Candidatus Aenigmarchaeota archaeon]